MDDRISLKKFYRFVEFTMRILGIDMPHERFKMIALDKYKAQSKDEIKVKRLANAYIHAINNANQIISHSLLKEIYYLLENKELSDEKTNMILKKYYELYDESIHTLAANVHMLILELLNDGRIEFAFIVSNLIMLKNNRNPLIPHLKNGEKYHEIINKGDIRELTIYFIEIECVSISESHKVINIEEVYEKICNIKLHLIKRFNIKKLYLYGSVAKESNTNYSDIDFLVVYEQNLNNFKNKLRLAETKEYLQKYFDVHIDVIDFDYALSDFDIGEMENIKTLI